jgi:hypothetical protein
VLSRLLECYETAAGILRAPSGALRAAGVAPALVARIVAAPRQRAATEAGLKSLERMGILPLPFLAPDYPQRLRTSPEPPLLLYVQGRWPLPPAASIAWSSNTPEHQHAIAGLFAGLRQLGIQTMTTALHLDILPGSDALGILPFGLLLARSRVPDPLRSAVTQGRATLLSVAPVNAPATPVLETIAEQTLIALADGLVMAGASHNHAVRPDLHHWRIGADGFIVPNRPEKNARGDTGTAIIARALGIRPLGESTVQQEPLW